MPEFGTRSNAHLQTVHWKLLMIAEEAIKITDFSIVEGYRSNTRQAQLLASGHSKAGPGDSKHNVFPARAFDFAPYPIDWQDTERFVYVWGVIYAAAYSLGLHNDIRWGGDWDRDERMADERFRDYGHVELID